MAELVGVVQLPIIGNGVAVSVLNAGHGLLAPLHIHHSKAGVGKCGMAGNMNTRIIGAPVPQPVSHPFGKRPPKRGFFGQRVIIIAKSRDSTHNVPSFLLQHRRIGLLL